MSNGTASKRLYVIRPGIVKALANPKPRLIRATSQAVALRFATAGIYEVEVAGPEDVAELVGNGTKPEDAE